MTCDSRCCDQDTLIWFLVRKNICILWVQAFRKTLDQILCSHLFSAEHGESNCFDHGVAIIQGGKICGKTLLEIPRLARCTRDDWMINTWEVNNTNTVFFPESHLLVVWVGMCISQYEKFRKNIFQRSIGTTPVILPEFWCVFLDQRAGRKNAKVGLRISISVFLLPSVFGVGVEGAGLHADSSNAFQTVGTAELRCSTLLMPHVPQQLQQRCRVESRGLWKCISPKFRGDWKNITIFFVGWTCLLIINFFFWVYLGDSVTKPLHPTVSCCFAHGSITGCTERPFGGETTQPFWQEGSKCWYVLQLGESTPSEEVQCQMILVTWWCLVRWDSFSTLGFWLGGVLWFVSSQCIRFCTPEPGGAHRPTGRLWPAGCGSARQPKPSVTSGGANSWRKKMVVRLRKTKQKKNTRLVGQASFEVTSS